MTSAGKGIVGCGLTSCLVKAKWVKVRLGWRLNSLKGLHCGWEGEMSVVGGGLLVLG